MSDAKIIVKLNAVPVGQYAQGNSVIVQGDTPEEVETILAELIPGGSDDNGALILAHFAETALVQAVGAALASPPPAAAQAATEAAAPAAGPVTVDQQALASAALLAVAAKKSGKSVEELGTLTTAQAKEIIAAAK